LDRFKRAFGRFEKAYKKFREIVQNQAISELFKEEFLIEIATKRFEYTFESMWKAVKEFLRIRGIECNSPRSCFKELLKEGLVPFSYEEELARMIMLRNQLVHIYDELQAKQIYDEIREERFLKTFEQVLKALKKVVV